MKIVSGMRPTGKLHLGHYLGVIKNWLILQENNECMFFIADWHALTNKYKDTSDLKENIFQMMIDWLSCGIDPQKATVFIQSAIKEHSELALLLGMITPKSWLELNPSYKDLKFNLFFQYIRDFLYGKNIKIQEEQLREIVYKAFYHKKDVDFGLMEEELKKISNEKVAKEIVNNLAEGEIGKEIDTFGFFGYPVLMAADILIYKAEAVPVGEDQLPHIEITREIARRFNRFYKEVFPEPKALLTPQSKLLGIDGRKMSKSYNNAIYLADTEEELNKKVLSMKTDPSRIRKTDKGNPDICNVFSYHKLFTDEDIVKEIDTSCRNAQIGCIDCKKILAKNLNKFLEPIREKRAFYEKNKEDLIDIFKEGNNKAKKEASENMHQIRNAMNLWID
ncbi:tryptophan--tRNA ligase [Venenivibrio stagnispumantis]|uniref:Tryptophan--tRNA ligase n=1 Tax=Venenivibrio stagnispumantis TaxID=407998 RepID=A0AA45WIH1_9AQUI|nr:tryptophan--tRNA ligase [Venenivibrio stagnispumantis]MCW4572598.1 tryptophan--tRNA ligase [Venenivibrio stagnispumantis]SMP00495.1 tryptophanyl-tRNA synthetase [Venenivibrio stagnispumantis]